MKFMRILLLVCVATTFTYCSDDSTDDAMEQNDDNGDNSDNGVSSEGDTLDADIVANGLRIPGATQVTAVPPQTTGGINFVLDDTASALVGEGFEQYVSSDDNFDGVYLIISDINGNVADSYYDIPAAAIDGRSSIKGETNSMFKRNREALVINQGIINVGFDQSVPAGRICYSICVYDSAGNISQPQEVCVVIESLGGNDALLGEWNLANFTESYDGQTVSAGLNEEFCFDEVITCDNGGTVTTQQCSLYERIRFTFNADGSYVLDERVIDNDIDFTATAETCTEVRQEEQFYEYLSSGVWAYNNTSQKLVIVENAYTENENGDIFTENYPAGEGEVFFDIPVSISGNMFVLTDSSEDGSGDTVIITMEK